MVPSLSLGFSRFLLPLLEFSWFLLSLGFGRFLLPLLGSVGSFSLSLGFGRFLLSLLGSVGSFSLSWVLLVPFFSLEFSWFLLPLLGSVGSFFLSWVQLQTYKLNFRFSDVNFSNFSFNFDYLLFDVFQRCQFQ